MEELTKKVKPHQLGWLRRPELDKPGLDIWEMPDGTLVAAESGHVFEITIFENKEAK